jgi:sucrose phosphorylase
VWTTFSPDQIDLDYRNPDVLIAILTVLLTYVERGARIIRLDAIAFLWKDIGTSCVHLPQTHHAIQLMRTLLTDVAGDITLITETNVPHPDNVSYFGDGTNDAHLVYNFALPPLTLHSFHSGNATALSNWARGLTTPSPDTTFFNFLASHDGIGVGGARGYLTESQISAMADRVIELGGHASYRSIPNIGRIPYELNIGFPDALGRPGEREDESTVARRFLTAEALMLSLPGMPGIYFHSLFGSRSWPEGVAETGAPRTINREKLERDELERTLDEPDTFRHTVFHGHRRLLSIRAGHAAFDPNAQTEILDLDPAVFAIRRWWGADVVTCLHNVSSEPVAISDIGFDRGTDLIADAPVETTLELDAYATLWIVEPPTV